MMYSNRFVASVKVGGKILREQNGSVSLPFGSEYSLLLKNLGSRRALVNVTIDGVAATEDKLILQANGSVDLERFLKSGKLDSGNKFKFIERTAQIEDYRGIGESDGLVRCEFWAEKEVIEEPIIRRRYYDEWRPTPIPHYWPYWTTYTSTSGLVNSGELYKSAEPQFGALNQAQNSQMSCMALNCATSSLGIEETSANDAGITVPGSFSNQQFTHGSWFATESNSTVIVLQLKGIAGERVVEKPITVDLRPTCPTCGRSGKARDRYCPECGTFLKLF